MDQKFLKRLIDECPLSNFTEDEASAERHKIFDGYLEKFTDFLYKNENQLVEQLWNENIILSEAALLNISVMLRRCFLFLDCAAAIYNYTARRSRTKKILNLQNMFLFNYKMI